MKKNIALLALMCTVAFLSSCADDSKAPAGTIKLSEESVNIPRIGGTGMVKLTAGSPWKVSIPDAAKAWLTIDPSTGSHAKNTEITITVASVKDGEEVNANIKFQLVDGSGEVILAVNRVDATPCRSTDSLALLAIYKSMNGTKWKDKWNTKVTIREWPRVTMALIENEWRVTAVLLEANDAGGEIPSEIGLLSELRNFSCEQPKDNPPAKVVTGIIPESLYNLKNLVTFNIAYNEITGAFPAKLFDITSLEQVKLTANKFDSAPFPQNIANATKLKEVYMSYLGLTGPIPKSIEALDLSIFYVDNNKLSGELPDFSKWKSLQIFDISFNCDFEAVTKKTEDGLISYNSFNVKGGGFTGKLVFEDMPLLYAVGCACTNISESPQFKNTPNIAIIHMYNNPLLTSMDEKIGDLTKLRALWIHECSITSLPAEPHWWSMERFWIYSNKIATLPDSIGSMGRAYEFRAFMNEFETMPDVFDKMKGLKEVFVGYCNLKSVPQTLWGRTGLLGLELQGNKIEGELPESFIAHRNLIHFYFSDNEFTGSIAPITSLVQVQDLIFSNNKFSGEIPKEIGNLKTVKILRADNNNLSGSIPNQIGNCVALNELRLSQNKLTGVIPDALLSNRLWCTTFKGSEYIVPQQTGAGFEQFTNPCK